MAGIEGGFTSSAVGVAAAQSMSVGSVAAPSVEANAFSGLANIEVGPQVTDSALSPQENPFSPGWATYSPTVENTLLGGQANPVSTLDAPPAYDILAEAEAVAEKAWSSGPEVTGTPTTANLEANAQALAVYAGLYGLSISSNTQTEAPVSNVVDIPTPIADEVAMVAEVKEPTISIGTKSVDAVVGAVEANLFTPSMPEVTEPITELPIETRSEIAELALEEMAEQVIESPKSNNLEIVSSSDEAVAQRVLSLAEEIGRPDLADVVNYVISERSAQREEVSEADLPNMSMDRPSIQDKKTDTPQATIPKPDDPERIRVAYAANSRRAELLEQVIREEAEVAQKESREANVETIADTFEIKAQDDIRARSPLLDQVGSSNVDGGITEAAKDLRNMSAENVLSHASRVVEDHTAVILGPNGQVAPESAAVEALYGGSRRYAALAE